MSRAESPVLLKVTVCVELGLPTWTLPKFNDVLSSEATGPVPVPLTVMLAGGALLTIETVALRVPAAAGANLTLMVQLPVPGTTVVQL